jgi:serine/threonine protein phosphatase PrpC
MEVNDEKMRCLVIASDGVTNFISPNEAVWIAEKFQYNRERGQHEEIMPAQMVVNQALKNAKNPRKARGPADNTSAIVIIFMGKGKNEREDSTNLHGNKCKTPQSNKSNFEGRGIKRRFSESFDDQEEQPERSRSLSF